MGTAAIVSHPILSATKSHRILLCLDRSPFSEVCVPHAVSLAKTFGSAMTVAYVMPSSPQHSRSPTNDPLNWEIDRQEARRYLERFRDQLSATLGTEVDMRLEQGRPAERILDLAREIGADLTVIGSRGEGGAVASSLGGTVQQVLAAARTSIFVAQSSSIDHANIGTAPKRILVPLDGSQRTESVLPAAARLANNHGGELLLVHVVQEPTPTALLRNAEDMELALKLAARLEYGAQRYLERLQDQLANQITSVRSLVVRHRNEHQCLLEIARREASELILLSAHGSSCDSNSSFGSITSYLLTHANVPVFVLQDLPEEGAVYSDESDKTPGPQSVRASYAPQAMAHS